MRYGLRQWLALASVALLAIGAYDGMDLFRMSAWQWRRDAVEGVKGDGPFVDSSRILVRRHMSKGERALLWTDGGTLTSIDRTLAEALCWELTPKCLAIGRDSADCDAVVVGPTRNDGSAKVALEQSGFLLEEELDDTQLWRRSGRDEKVPSVGEVNRSARPPVARDVLAAVVIAACLLLVMSLAGIARGVGAMAGIRGTVFGVLLFVVCACLVLGSDLPANFGLGVYGGKARLWLLSESGIFLDGSPASAVLQPSYPPMFPFLVWIYDDFVAGCSERCIRMLPALFMSIALGSLCARARGWLAALFIFSVFISRPLLATVVAFGAEPLMVLLAVAGIAAARDGKEKTGFFIIGCCGLVKTEGVIIALFLWCVMSWARSPQGRRIHELACLVLALLPGLVWIVFAALHGEVPQDYAMPWAPDFARMLGAASKVFHEAFLYPWRYGFVFLVAVGVLAMRVMRSDLLTAKILRQILAAAAFPLLMACAYVYILSLSRAPDFAWHCQSLARILMPPVVIAIALAMSGGPLNLCKNLQQGLDFRRILWYSIEYEN